SSLSSIFSGCCFCLLSFIPSSLKRFSSHQSTCRILLSSLQSGSCTPSVRYLPGSDDHKLRFPLIRRGNRFCHLWQLHSVLLSFPGTMLLRASSWSAMLPG